MPNIIIIGNGFDLAHGLRSGYIDFVKSIIDNQIKDQNRHPKLFETDPRFENYDKLIEVLSENEPIIAPLFKNDILRILLMRINSNKWCDIEEEYFKLLIEINEKNGDIIKFNGDFEAIKLLLEEYLNLEFETVAPQRNEQIARYFSKFKLNKTIIINFNYTGTLDLYINELQNIPIYHIHGKILDGNNKIIFGYAADEKEFRKLSESGNVEYVRNIKKFLYNQTSNDFNIRNFLKNPNKLPIKVFILGHSCGISDKLILSEIFNDVNLKEINIVYHNDFENYFKIQYNIDRIIQSNLSFERITNYKKAIRFPQMSDSVELIEEFNKKLMKAII